MTRRSLVLAVSLAAALPACLEAAPDPGLRDEWDDKLAQRVVATARRCAARRCG